MVVINNCLSWPAPVRELVLVRPFLPCHWGSVPVLVLCGAGEKPLSLPSKVEWVSSAALATAAVLAWFVASELF